MPKVSVVIPTYNRAHFLARAIQSVLNQAYQDFEIVIVDDCSSDNTADIVASFDDERIRSIRHEENKGGAAARNTGIEAARGQYIAFQDSDDEWLPDKLEKQMRVFETGPPEVGVIYTDMQRIDEDGEIKYWQSPTLIYRNLINPRTMDYQVTNIGIQSALIRRDCFDEVGLFDVKLPRLMDLELFIRLSKRYLFHHIKEPLVKYYTTAGISSDTNALVMARKLLLEKYFEELKGSRKFCSHQYFGIGVALFADRQFRQGRIYLIKAVTAYPLHIKALSAALLSLLGQRAYNRAAASYRRIRDWLSKGQ